MNRVPDRRRPHAAGPALSAYLDGALPSQRAARLERHLAGCPACTADLAQLRATKLSVSGLAAAEPVQDWLPAIEGRFRVAAPAPRRSHRTRYALRRRTVLVSTLAAALGIGIWLAPPPPAPVTFQDQVRQHLVQIDEPMTDQTSYVVEARYP